MRLFGAAAVTGVPDGNLTIGLARWHSCWHMLGCYRWDARLALPHHGLVLLVSVRLYIISNVQHLAQEPSATVLRQARVPVRAVQGNVREEGESGQSSAGPLPLHDRRHLFAE